MNNRTFRRIISFYNVEVFGEFFSNGEESDKLIILLPPNPKFGGSMQEPVISSIFQAYQEKDAYVLRIEYNVNKNNEDDFYQMMVQTTIAIEEAKTHFSVCGSSLFNIWLVGLSDGASIALQMIQRRIDIHGVIMISPILQRLEPKSFEQPKENVFLCYSDNDPITPVELYHKYIDEIQPTDATCFRGGGHVMNSVKSDITEYVVKTIDRYNNYVISDDSN